MITRLTALSNNIRVLAAFSFSLLTACGHVTPDKAAKGQEVDSSKMAILKKPIGAQSLLSRDQFEYIEKLYEEKADSTTLQAALIRFADINDSLHAHYTKIADTLSDDHLFEKKTSWGYSLLTPEVYLGKRYDSITHTYGPTYAREYVGRHFLYYRKVGFELRIPFTYTVIRKKRKEGDSTDQLVIHMPKNGGIPCLLNAGAQPGTMQRLNSYVNLDVEKDLCWASFFAVCTEQRKVMAQPSKDGKVIISDGDWVPPPGTRLNEENRKRLTLNSYNSFSVDGYLRMKLAPGSTGPFSETNRPRLEYIDGWDFFGGGPR